MVQVNFNRWGDGGFQPRPFDDRQPTFVIIHGYQNTGGNAANGFMPEEWISDKAQTLRDRNPDANIIVVDWEDGAKPSGLVGINYPAAADNTRDVGSQLAQELIRLEVDPIATELIGHSLGAHVSGFAGAAYQEQTGRSIARITGLDPAGPRFEGNPPQDRLDPTDAEKVVAIHTSKTLGHNGEVGDLDIFLNQNYLFQPGAQSFVDNHGYAFAIHDALIQGESIPQVNGGEFNLDTLNSESGRIEIDTNRSIFVGTTSGQFAGESNRLSLGSPEFSSFVQFDGTSFRTVTGKLFNLGDLTYQNGASDRGSEPQGDLPLAIATSFVRPISNTQTFTFDFNSPLTPNDTGNLVFGGDRLRFSSSGLSSERIEAVGTEYTLDLFGFSTDDGFSVIRQFDSPENSTTNASLFGKITVAESRIIPPLLWDKIRSGVARAGIGLVEGWTTSISTLNPLSNSRTANSSAQNSTPEDVFKITEEIATQFPGGVLGSGERDVAIGSSIEDVVFGDGGADFLAGSVGDDIIFGADDDDELYGGKNDDFLNGNQGNDLVSGDLGHDFLRGGRDNDTLVGGDGDDVLVGDRGVDLLTGGLGADVFILRTDTGEVTPEPSAADRILDFNAAEGDRIGITGGVPIEVLSFAPADINGNGIEDTIIQYTETDDAFGTLVDIFGTDIFGIALDVAPDVARNAAFSVPIEEPLLLI